MRHLSVLLWGLTMLAGWPAATMAAEAAGGEYDLWAQVNDFHATPDKVRTEQQPRLWDQLGSRTNEGARQDATTNGYSARKSGGTWIFRIAGNVPEIRTMCWQHVIFQADAGKGTYYLLRYRARGQRRNYQPLAVLAISGVDGKGKAATAPLLDASEVINDDRWHVVLGKVAAPITVKSIEAQLSTVGSEATIEIGGCSLYAAMPKVAAEFAPVAGKSGKSSSFRAIDLSAAFNGDARAALDRSLGAHGKIVDGGALPAGSLMAGAVPFRVGQTGKNIITPPSDPKANQGTVNVLGTELSKINYKRVARDDRIKVAAAGKASEVYFLLVSEMAPTIGRYSLPSIPLQLFNTDTFAVEIVYAEGEADWAFPYSLADQGHSLQRAVGEYVVPANPNRELKSLVFHNRFYGASFNLAAVTLNGGPAATLTPSRVNPAAYRVAKVSPPATQPARLTAKGNRLTIETGDYLCQLDCTNGFAISRLAHKWSPQDPIALGAQSGLEVRVGERVLAGRDLRLEKLTTSGGTAVISLLSKDAAIPLRLTIQISASSPQQIAFGAVAANLGTSPLATQIRFPVLKGLALGGLPDTWMFFPQCRNVLTNEPGTYFAPTIGPL